MATTYKTAAQRRIERQADYGTATILFVALSMISLFMLGIAHDLQLLVPALACIAGVVVGLFGAVICNTLGSEC